MSIKLPLWLYMVTLLSLIGLFSVLIATVQGAGISPDSVAYVGVARNLISGRGLSLPYGQVTDVPLTQFPPLYPALLASSGLLGIELLEGVRWLQAFLFTTLIFLAGLLLRQYGTPWIATLGAAYLLVSPTPFAVATMVWSEALFLVLTLTTLWLLARFLEDGSQLHLLTAALVAGAATLTRYSGITLIMTGCVAVFWLSHVSLRTRLFNSSWFALLSLLPLVLWFVRNLLLAGTATNREFSFHPIGQEHLRQALTTIAGWWMVPSSAPSVLKLTAVLLSLCLIAVVILLPWRQADHLDAITHTAWMGRQRFAKLLALYLLIYGAFVVFSISFLDANTPLDGRILAPAWLAVMALCLLAATQLIHYLQRTSGFARLLQALLVTAGALLLVLSAQQSIQQLATLYTQGSGFSSVRWRDSELIEIAKQLPANTVVFSNAPDAIYLLTKRRALGIPPKIHAMTRQPNPDYARDFAQMRLSLHGQDAVLIYFTQLGRASATEQAELQTGLDLSVLVQSAEGTVYQAATLRGLATP